MTHVTGAHHAAHQLKGMQSEKENLTQEAPQDCICLNVENMHIR